MQEINFSDQIRILLRSINLQMAQLMNENFQPLGLSTSQALILIELCHAGSMMVSQLSEQLEMPASNISSICNRLERGGLVKRTRDEEDQRKVRIELTKGAANLTKAAKDRMLKKQREIADSVSEEDRQVILDGLEKLHELIHDTRTGCSEACKAK